MFKKFDPSNDVSTSTQVKSSVQRAIKSDIHESHTNIPEEWLDLLLPKKEPMTQYKVGPHLVLYCRNNEPVFFQPRDGPILPTLRLVHAYPQLVFQQVQVDQGAIPFILGGAHIMCPGLTNAGGHMPPDVQVEGVIKDGLNVGDAVVVYAQGKEYALAVGMMKMTSRDMYVLTFLSILVSCVYVSDYITRSLRFSFFHSSCLVHTYRRSKNKGIAIEVHHYLGDGLFNTTEIS